jgi:hypothetical protein
MLLAAIILVSLGIFTGYTGKVGETKTQYEWKQVTVVESVVAAGLGRSRMITTDANGKLDEIKMKNFFSVTGINFGNLKENDLLITDKIQQLSNEGWELYDTTTGVAMYGVDNSDGIFMPRDLFRKGK